MVRDYQTSAGIDVAVSSWGPIQIVPGFTNSATGTPVLLDGSALGVAATPTAAITALSSNHYIQLFNGNVQSQLGTSDLGGAALRRFGSSVSLTKYETIGSPTVTSSRFVITSSHNIKTVN